MAKNRIGQSSDQAGVQGDPGSRDMRVAAGLALGLASIVFSILFLSTRHDAPPLAQPETSPGVSSPQVGSSVVPVPPEPLSDSDQRLVATRRSSELLVGAETRLVQPESSQGSEAVPSKFGQPSSNPSAAAPEPPIDDKNVRQLLRRARKQSKAGETQGIVSTSAQIAALLPTSESRSKIESAIEQAKTAARQGQNVDFDSLIQLIEQTVSPNTWTTVGGAGSVKSFPGGVYIDTGGLIRPRGKGGTSPELARVRQEVRPTSDSSDASKSLPLRKVSLPRLEKEAARKLACGEPLSDDIRFLAGLQEVKYVLVYPEEHDVVVVGPAENWRADDLGRPVGQSSGRPVMQLDDLVEILRACYSDSKTNGLFGCGIYPRTERLKQVQEFLNASAARGPIEPSQRNRWLEDLRNQLGEQDIEVFGIHSGSRVAHVLVEADYRMKLVGIGIEEAAVPGIPSYFELLGNPDDARLSRGLDTLRWWFTLNYDSILTTPETDAFELRGDRVQVMSENELLTATGKRVHTGQSDPLNEQFSRNFTRHFGALSEKDTNFADLACIFDMAVVGGLLRGHNIPLSIGWDMGCFLDRDEYVVPLLPVPRTVETVINHQVYGGRHIMAAVSGGVHVNPWKIVTPEKLQTDPGGRLAKTRSAAQSPRMPNGQWWWD